MLRNGTLGQHCTGSHSLSLALKYWQYGWREERQERGVTAQDRRKEEDQRRERGRGEERKLTDAISMIWWSCKSAPPQVKELCEEEDAEEGMRGRDLGSVVSEEAGEFELLH